MAFFWQGGKPAVLILGLAVTGCFRQPAPVLDGLPEKPAENQPTKVIGRPEARVYEVVNGQLLVKVYRAGRLAKLGHNHTIEAPIFGKFSFTENQVFADLYVRPADLLVDQAQTRALQGEDFAKPIKPGDVEGTRGNLLSEQVLNPLQNPFIRASIDSTLLDAEFTPVTFELAGREFTKGMKIETVSDNSCQPIFRGEVVLSHNDFGLTPFSILGGAVSVRNEFAVSVELSGAREDLSAAECY